LHPEEELIIITLEGKEINTAFALLDFLEFRIGFEYIKVEIFGIVIGLIDPFEMLLEIFVMLNQNLVFGGVWRNLFG